MLHPVFCRKENTSIRLVETNNSNLNLIKSYSKITPTAKTVEADWKFRWQFCLF